jgi:C1A family cysteine protease
MLAVGYSDRSEAFIVRNSWGEEWVSAFSFLTDVFIYF